ncbi:4Fe-4S dicluster domain-containing protein [candidate division KSB1 bacterium]|nr:4Fe-4S dicluster domain-containing protein [candidate division KSB1 bacterium]
MPAEINIIFIVKVLECSIIGAVCGFLLLVIHSFIKERQIKAMLGVTVLLFIAISGFGFIVYSTVSVHFITVFGFMVFLFVAIAITLPFAPGAHNYVVGEQSRVDERDALFHRFYRLQPDTPEFLQYYHDHPEIRDIDAAIRKLPALTEPGSRSYNPVDSPMMASIMDVVNSITRDIDWPPSTSNIKPFNLSPKDASQRIKAFARYLGADLVGTTKLNPAYIYSHIGRAPGEWGAAIHLPHTHAIAIAVEMRSDMLAYAPAIPATIETSDTYFTTAKIAMVLAKYISMLGYEARAHVDGNYRVMCVPIAVDAGLGEPGRLGLLITPQFGPRVRLSIVTTNLELTQDRPISFGVQHFCSICKKCADNCPGNAIARHEPTVVRGVRKWVSQQEACYRFWRKQGTDCGVCIRVCPYAHSSLPMHRIMRWLVNRNSFARRFALLGENVVYGRRHRANTANSDWLTTWKRS